MLQVNYLSIITRKYLADSKHSLSIVYYSVEVYGMVADVNMKTDGVFYIISYGWNKVAGPAPRGRQEGPGPPFDMLGPQMNQLTVLKTSAFVLNFKLWPP